MSGVQRGLVAACAVSRTPPVSYLSTVVPPRPSEPSPWASGPGTGTGKEAERTVENCAALLDENRPAPVLFSYLTEVDVCLLQMQGRVKVVPPAVWDFMFSRLPTRGCRSLGCNGVWTCRQIPLFRRNLLPPSSGLKFTWRYSIEDQHSLNIHSIRKVNVDHTEI
jgi:hypothetical protein